MKLKEKGIAEVTLANDVIAAIKEAAAPVRDEWIKANTDAGLPAQELYDFALKTVGETAGK